MPVHIRTLVIAIVLSHGLTPWLLADDGGWTPRTARDHAAPDVAAVTNAEYQVACGQCHLAYQPGLLPTRSWQALIDALPHHFGDRVDLDADVRIDLQRYLGLAAADRSGFVRSIKIMVAIPDDTTPRRISRLAHIVEEHDKSKVPVEIAARRVGGAHRCDRCHTRAAQGFYNEDEVMMPLMSDTPTPADPPQPPASVAAGGTPSTYTERTRSPHQTAP